MINLKIRIPGISNEKSTCAPFSWNMLYKCFLSWCFAVSELQCVSTLSQSVRMQDILCPMGWLLLEASILSVVVGFLYTLVVSRPDSSRVTKMSKNVEEGHHFICCQAHVVVT